MSDIPDYILRTYKSTFDFYVRDPSAKMVVPRHVSPTHPRDCKYCGGIGTLVVFVATDGPYQFAPSGANVIAAWLGNAWYGGKHVEERCPACHGLGIDPEYKEPPIRKHEIDISGIVKETPKVEVPAEATDYTDY